MSDHAKIETLRKLAFELSAAEQYRLAFFIAENIGYEIKKPEPEVITTSMQQ